MLNQALDRENPLSPLTLELSLCGSNTEKALEILTNDPGVQNIPESEILDWFYRQLFDDKDQSPLQRNEIEKIFEALETSYNLYTHKKWLGIYYDLEISHLNE